MHASVSVGHSYAPVHSSQFVQAAISDSGLSAMLDAAKGLAMVAVDLLADPELMKRVKAEFARAKS